MKELRQHPLSAAFPAMSDDDIAVLADDIKANGLLEPAILFEGMVLDGWHRYRACKLAGVKFVTQPFGAGDPADFVLSRNLHRRHLSASQRAAAIVAARDWRPHGDQKTTMGNFAHRSQADQQTTIRKIADRTTAEMAKEADVSARTIKSAKAAHRAGLGEEVKEGRVTASAAAEVAKLPPGKREEAVDAIKRGVKPTPLAKSAKTKAPADLQRLYEVTKAELDEAKDALADAADTIRELDAKVRALEITDPTEQQKEILRLERENAALKRSRNEFQTKSNELIQQVKILKRALDKKGK